MHLQSQVNVTQYRTTPHIEAMQQHEQHFNKTLQSIIRSIRLYGRDVADFLYYDATTRAATYDYATSTPVSTTHTAIMPTTWSESYVGSEWVMTATLMSIKDLLHPNHHRTTPRNITGYLQQYITLIDPAIRQRYRTYVQKLGILLQSLPAPEVSYAGDKIHVWVPCNDQYILIVVTLPI